MRPHANTETITLIQESMMQRGLRIRREQRMRLIHLGKNVFWVTNEERVQQQQEMLNRNGTLFELDLTLRYEVTFFNRKISK